MKQLTSTEILSMSKLLQMETNSLALAKASINIISDEQLRTVSEAGVVAAEARIMGLQQFISDNNVQDMGGVH